MRSQVKTCKLLFVVPLLSLLLVHQIQAQATARIAQGVKMRSVLESGWKFREAGKDAWYPAIVPGCVHTDLMNNKLIGDPFYRDNEQKLQWIGKTDWDYQTTFNVTPELLKRRNIELVFEGLDTYASVFLNDAPLLNADNMFRTWRVDAKGALKAGANTLRIRFRSPINEVMPAMAKLDYQLPAPNDQGEKTSPWTRKAPYQFGWDWGPRFVTSGVWKPVALEAWDGARINDLHILQSSVTKDVAQLTAEVQIISDSEMTVALTLDSFNGRTSIPLARQGTRLHAGINLWPINVEIQHPSLWWPNGLGPQNLYNFKARLLTIGGRPLDQTTTRTGLRSLELRQQADEGGKSFEFVINGVPVFAKGGNWIPADSFPTRISKDRYRHLLESVRDTNMNMLRVWGGGIYESNDFYDLCDEMGILVWQDFMFACSMYPGDRAFLDNVRAEATDNVKRLRNHPSISIWVGNNEVETAWQHWGWKQNLPARLWDDYLKIFHGVLKEVCASLDPSRPYWPSSPSSNLLDDPDSQKMGDVHYWAVWHASKPFEEYEKQFPRFMSEYGFQSFPQIETVNSYTVPADHDIQSPVMLAHQRHPRGNQLIREYMLREYPQPKDFESFLYVSQVLQAEGIKIGAEHMRRIMPHNMGSLYWQIDDCWPVASWSSIDYNGRWKALQYYARRFYSPLLVSPHVENENINFYIVSDRTENVQARLNISLMDFEARTLKNLQKEMTVNALQSKSYLSIPVSELLQGQDRKRIVLYCELLIDGKPVSTNEYFFEPYKNLSVPKPQITTDVSRVRDRFIITLDSDKFARAVYLSLPNHEGSFNNNYFDLLPGKKVAVEFRTREALAPEDLRNQLKIRTMADAF
jgi:beta-mannosidase